MSASALPDSVVAFLDAEVFSVPQLELLLLLREHADGARTPQQIAADFYLPVATIGPWLDAFVSRGLVELSEDGYRFAPRDEPLAASVADTAECYARRRITVSRHIYTTTEDPVRRFADAFRLRKDPNR